LTSVPGSSGGFDKSDTCELSYKPWWERGLFFSCLGCGRCCRGEPGSVWVGEDDIEAMAGSIGLDVHYFRELYIRKEKNRLSLRERVNGDCVMYESQSAKCLVYGSRPLQCRLFPFWPSILSSRENWIEYSSVCPGMDQGRLWSIEEISSFLALSPFVDL